MEVQAGPPEAQGSWRPERDRPPAMPFPVLAEGLPKKLESEAPMLICSPPTALPALAEEPCL